MSGNKVKKVIHITETDGKNGMPRIPNQQTQTTTTKPEPSVTPAPSTIDDKQNNK